MDGTTAAMPQSATRHWREGWTELEALAQKVELSGTQELPGCTLRHEFLIPLLQKGLRSNYLLPAQYRRMMNLLRFGADLFIDKEYLNDHLPSRVYRKNYPSAYENKVAVTTAIAARVTAGRTMKIGVFLTFGVCEPPRESGDYLPYGCSPKTAS